MEKKNVNKVVFVVAVVALVLLTVFIVQNADKITVSFFGWDFSLPTSVLIIATFVIGFLGGLIFDAVLAYRARKRKHNEQLMKDYIQRVEQENRELKEKEMENDVKKLDINNFGSNTVV